jgi:integrase/recombinase XerD
VLLVLSQKEIKHIQAMIPNLKAKVMMSLAYGCGMRAGEVGDIVPEARLRYDRAQEIIRIVQAKG